MLASFRHNFIFIKTRKTAGTSIEMALTPFCGPDDIVTPLHPDDERQRMLDGVVQARNYCDDVDLRAAFDRAVREGAPTSNLMKRLRAQGWFFNHMPASKVAALLPDLWARAYKWTVERHPYEKVVSSAFWRTRGSQNPTLMFPAALSQVIARAEIADQSPAYTIGGDVAVDRIIRYEDLDTELPELLARIGLPPVALPLAKAGHRRDRRSARDILSDEQKRTIFRVARSTFDRLGYLP